MKQIIYSFLLTVAIVNISHLEAQTNYESKMLDAQQKLAASKTEADYNNTSRIYNDIANSQKQNR